MPVVDEHTEPKRRGRLPGALALLLLVPPLLGVALLIAAAFRPLELGPLIVMTMSTPAPARAPWLTSRVFGAAPRSGVRVTLSPAGAPRLQYQPTAPGRVLRLCLGGRAYYLGWFPGHRVP
ncbi:MAG: hypothetical protein K0Q72_4474 [Armatimonadetes bacterium]|jgi:hypothetical protein|nr:hypothetical protein [Armatimonadota bacterium]